jgi:hypothetical protein
MRPGPALLFAFGFIQIWHIYLALFLRAVAGGFHQSAFGASIVLLVPKENLARVQGFNQALYGGLNIISAPLGAYLLSVIPMQGILGIDWGRLSRSRSCVYPDPQLNGAYKRRHLLAGLSRFPLYHHLARSRHSPVPGDGHQLLFHRI